MVDFDDVAVGPFLIASGRVCESTRHFAQQRRKRIRLAANRSSRPPGKGCSAVSETGSRSFRTAISPQASGRAVPRVADEDRFQGARYARVALSRDGDDRIASATFLPRAVACQSGERSQRRRRRIEDDAREMARPPIGSMIVSGWVTAPSTLRSAILRCAFFRIRSGSALYPNLAALCERMEQRPSFVGCRPRAEKHQRCSVIDTHPLSGSAPGTTSLPPTAPWLVMQGTAGRR